MGLRNCINFTEEEWITLPDISVLYPLWEEYNVLKIKKEAVEKKLTTLEVKNANLPDHSSKIGEIEIVIEKIDHQLRNPHLSLELRKQKKLDRELLIGEITRLNVEQTATDLTQLKERLTELTRLYTEKISEINEESNRLGEGNLI